MDDYLLITQLNDFIFCPYSIYLKRFFGTNIQYTGTKQIDGKAAHEAIDNANYSSKKNVLQGIDVCSNELHITGKIDIFDIDKKTLTERKKKIVNIYDGYIFQLYAQYYCLREMGYNIEFLYLYSYDENRMFKIDLPDNNIEMKNKFFSLINDINNFDFENFTQENNKKCDNCIYKPMCSKYEEENC